MDNKKNLKRNHPEDVEHSSQMVEEADKHTVDVRHNKLIKIEESATMSISAESIRHVVEENVGSSNVAEVKQLINNLLREYFFWKGYYNTEHCLILEIGQNSIISRQDMAKKLNIIDTEETLKYPLIYFIFDIIS